MEELILIQSKLRVLKDQSKSGIQFKYRTTDDIFEKVKPLLVEHGVLLTVSDKVVNVGNSNYIEATATVSKGDKSISCTGMAKEPDKLMSMSAPQITGSCSSYARKTALGGLFAIDNNQDPDSGNNSNSKEATIEQLQEIVNLKEKVTPEQRQWADKAVNGGLSFDDANMVIKNLKGGQ